MKNCITPPQFCQELFAVALKRRRRCEKRGVQLGLKAAVRIPSERRRRREKRSSAVCRKTSSAAENAHHDAHIAQELGLDTAENC